MLRVVALVVLLGCSKGRTDREVDCVKVRAVVDRAVEGVPTRYLDSVLRDQGLSAAAEE